MSSSVTDIYRGKYFVLQIHRNLKIHFERKDIEGTEKGFSFLVSTFPSFALRLRTVELYQSIWLHLQFSEFCVSCFVQLLEKIQVQQHINFLNPIFCLTIVCKLSDRDAGGSHIFPQLTWFTSLLARTLPQQWHQSLLYPMISLLNMPIHGRDGYSIQWLVRLK